MSSSIPKMQHAAIVEKPGKEAKAIVKEIPVEEPQEGEVLIKMEATGGINIFQRIALIPVCHTDLHLQRDDWGPGFSMMCPVGGHEGVGRIVKLGPGVTNLKL
jgi:alcohol dehydrogenase, propanol-preferring